jgi:hypothetical protein
VRKARTALDEVIAQKPKPPALREHGSLVLERPVLEVENEPARHAIATRKLNEVAVGDDGAAVDRPKDQKSPDDTLRMTDGDRFRLQSARAEYAGDEEQWRTKARFQRKSSRIRAARPVPWELATLTKN